MMKRYILLTALVAFTTIMNAAPKVKTTVTRIDPTDWYVGLNNPILQLMVYGQNIRDVADVTTDYPGVTVDSIVRLDSPNYLLVYINVKNAQPGTMTLQFHPLLGAGGPNSVAASYQLKPREMPGTERHGFNITDVLYLLMPDRFAQSPQHNPQIPGMRKYREDRTAPSLRHGGDLEGIRQHLDYFTQLGVTALWFTPILENDSPDNDSWSTYHGYATTDYYRVDPRFGTNQQYRQLIDECHQRGLKVVMDMIFNHCGFEHPWVADMPSKDWFNLSEWLKESKGTSDSRGTSFKQTSYKLTPVLDPYASEADLMETQQGWFVSTMPDLNQRNPHLMRYLIQNSIWWIEAASIDGIRMDTYPYAYPEAMAQWMKELLDEYPSFNTVGETWVSQPAYTAAWQKDSKLVNGQFTPPLGGRGAGHPSPLNTYLPTVMDFAFQEAIDSCRHEQTDGWWLGLNRVYNTFVYDYLYPNPSSVLAFLENHDTDRFLADGQDTLMLKQALAILLTANRIPQLYYGTEILMNGTKAVTDGNVRKDFPGGFPGDKRNAFTPEGRTQAQNNMFNFLSRILHWRQNNKLISQGKMTQFIPHNGVYVIARTLPAIEASPFRGPGGRLEGASLTILNGTDSPATFNPQRYQEIISPPSGGRGASRWKDIPTGRYYDLSAPLQLKPRQTLILTNF